MTPTSKYCTLSETIVVFLSVTLCVQNVMVFQGNTYHKSTVWLSDKRLQITDKQP